MSNTNLLGAYGGLGNTGLMFRNKIINGNFDIWQRGTSATKSAPFSGNTFVADRSFAAVDSSATGSYTVSQQAFTPGQSDVPHEPSYFYRFATSSLVNSTNGFSYVLQQRVEDVRSLAGQTVTVSFYAKASANTSLSVNLTQAFGSGGSATNIVPAQIVSLTTSWQKITKTFSVPSISGKTIGANSYLGLEIFAALRGTTATAYGVSEFTALGTGSYDIAQVQLEAGPVATPFEHRPIGLELDLCQRYFERVDSDYLFQSLWSINRANGTRVDTKLFFVVEKRISASTTVSSFTVVSNYSPSGNQISFYFPGATSLLTVTSAGWGLNVSTAKKSLHLRFSNASTSAISDPTLQLLQAAPGPNFYIDINAEL